MSYKDFITEVPNFPKDGIGFKDISPLLADQETFRSSLVDMGGYFDDNLPDYWIGIDSRGFTFAGGLATYFGGGVVCARMICWISIVDSANRFLIDATY